MKRLSLGVVFGLVASVSLPGMASDGAEALARWQQQFKQEVQKQTTEKQTNKQSSSPEVSKTQKPEEPSDG